VIEQPAYAIAKGYYCNHLRVEMPPVGNDHTSEYSIIIYAVNLFAALHDVDLNGKDNATYYKAGISEAQTNGSFCIGEIAAAIPFGISIIDLEQYPAPDLIIEVANISLADEKGNK
jgi:Uma2 family endonuclease